MCSLITDSPEELKAAIEQENEIASHRAAQLPAYLELAAHHYPGRRIDLCYLTPPMAVPPPALEGGARFAHVSWGDIVLRAAQPRADLDTADLPFVRRRDGAM